LKLTLVLGTFVWSLQTSAQNPEKNQDTAKADAKRLIEEFEKSWDESAWENEFRTSPEKYMRSATNNDWQLRMRTLQALVRHGENAVDPLLESLDSRSIPVRVLAAQTLGFLNNEKALEKLLVVAQEDDHPTVRLYAIDSYGMLGGEVSKIEGLSESEKNRDAKMHAKYAIERDGKKISEEIMETLTNWDTSKMSAAKIGEQAPEFELETANGGKVSLSSFRGKSAVVLVFIYGDT
jgi:hypothetical protein